VSSVTPGWKLDARTFPQIGEIEFRWSGQVMEPVDYLAFIGRNPLDSTTSSSRPVIRTGHDARNYRGDVADGSDPGPREPLDGSLSAVASLSCGDAGVCE
jgi:hypothetical protein